MYQGTRRLQQPYRRQSSAAVLSMMRKIKELLPRHHWIIFFQKGGQNWIQEGTRTCAIHIRHEWNCSFPSILVLTLLQLSHLLSLLQSVSLPACSPSASPRVPAVALYYYSTVKLNMFSLILTCFLSPVCFICICVKSILSLLLYSTLLFSHQLTLCDPMDCSPPGSSVLGISQARILEWVAISFSRGSSWTHISCIGRRMLYHWATREAHSWFY